MNGAGDVIHCESLEEWAHQFGRQLNGAESIPLSLSGTLEQFIRLTGTLAQHPYCLPLYILLAHTYGRLGYPDLAAGAAYKALLLSDAVQDDSDEYHEQAVESLTSFSSLLPRISSDQCVETESSDNDDDAVDEQASAAVRGVYLPLIYKRLTRSLLECACYRSAFDYCSQSVKIYPEDRELRGIKNDVREAVAKHHGLPVEESRTGDLGSPNTWPSQGFVRREIYPWNTFEPDRLGGLDEINGMMSAVAPNLEVLATDLPVLAELPGKKGSGLTRKQLGVFAKNDIAPGEVVLQESSLLTANNKLQDALCDACSEDLPQIGSSEFNHTVACEECRIVFCGQECYDKAMEFYHPALCEKDLESIGRDVPPAEAADSLYSLLLLRALAMAETQQLHPLELKEVKYIWGDFYSPNDTDTNLPFHGQPQVLPFSFEHNIRLPFHMLEKMDIDIFRNPQYDVWVFNTLYAKFRGTASARLSGLGGRAIRGPEVSAVHSMWCMANHSCDPNVRWEWGGSIKFWAREERVTWTKEHELDGRSAAGIRKGEEILNHYCDIELNVKDRREWASGALGGDCRCPRCMWEAGS